MWSFKKSDRDFYLQVRTATDAIMAETRNFTPCLLRSLVGEEHVESSEGLGLPLKSELLAFGLHLTDRIALHHLGASNRAVFMDALLSAIQSELPPSVSLQLEDLYNSRNTFYGGFPKLIPDGDETEMGGTLIWEFGKALGADYANSNPIAITKASICGMDFMQAINQSFETAKVFP